jgi:hypothetical protein
MFASQHRAYPVVLTEARASLFKAFGLLPSYQEQLEEEFRAFILPQSEKVNFVTDPKSSVQYYVDRII